MTHAATTGQLADQPMVRQPGAGSSLPNVIRSEWTKLFSVRSTGWTLIALFVATVGLGTLACWGTNHAWPTSHPDPATFDPTALSLAGLTLGQLAIAVLGVLVVSSEYSTGGIRTTLTTVPQRMRLLTAKAIVLTVVSLVVGWITCFVSFFAGQAWFSNPPGGGAALSDPHVLRAVIGGGLYLGASALFGMAIALLIRHSAGAITIAIAMLLVVPPLLLLLPGGWGAAIVRYFTSNAGQHIAFVIQTGDNYLTPWVGFGVYCLWFAIPLGVGAWLMRRRDA